MTNFWNVQAGQPWEGASYNQPNQAEDYYPPVPHPNPHPCPQLPGTILRVYIPPGTEINLAGLVEISSPDGICLIIRIPLLAGLGNPNGSLDLQSVVNMIKDAGGSVEVQ